MKKSILALSIAAALLPLLPAQAAEPAVAIPVKPAAAKPEPTPRLEAFAAAAKELKEALGTGKGNPIPLLDKMVQYQHSEATRALLMKEFGVPSLFTVKPASAPAGKVAYQFVSPAHRYMNTTGDTVDWSPLDARVELDKEGRRMVATGSWASLALTAPKMAMTLNGMSLSSDQTRNSADIWLGKANYRLEKLTIGAGAGASGVEMVMDNMLIDSHVTERGKAISMAVDMRIDAISVGGEKVDNFRIASRMNNVDTKTFDALSRAFSGKENQMDQVKALMSAKPELIAFARSMAARGTAIEIDEISASFRGHKAMVNGRVSLARMKDADFASMDTFVKKLIARVEVKVPLALVGEIAGAVTRKQAAAKGQPLSEAAVAQASQGITDAMVGKLVTSGYGRVDNDMLISVIEFKGGKLTLNSKEVQLPKKRPAAAQVK